MQVLQLNGCVPLSVYRISYVQFVSNHEFSGFCTMFRSVRKSLIHCFQFTMKWKEIVLYCNQSLYVLYVPMRCRGIPPDDAENSIPRYVL
jgi:hypothetical protein